MVIQVLQVIGVLLAIGVWLFTVRRVATDPQLHPQARQGMSYAVLVMPLLAVVYWATAVGGRTPFWLAPLDRAEFVAPDPPSRPMG